MKRHNGAHSKILIIIASAVIGVVMFLIWFFGYMFYIIYSEKRQMPVRITRIIYQTNHQALLEACRKLSLEAREGKWRKGHPGYQIRTAPDPNTEKFPPIIMGLDPSAVIIDDERVIIEMLGGVIHYGVVAYTEDYIKNHPNDQLEDKELIKGLWYYDDGYREVPNYEKYIKTLKPE